MMFSDIIGQDGIKRHLQSAISSHNPVQSYIIEGEKLSGKKTLADTFSLGLMCEEGGTEPCGKCHSCRMILSGNHPDIVHVTHEKPDRISVDEIRGQVVNDCILRPYYGKYKIYIIDEAEKTRTEGQNALLKTLEDPPEYVILILLVTNTASLLPTILSRCVKLSTEPIPDADVAEYLMKTLSVPRDIADTAAAFSRGNIGKAMNLAESDAFLDTRSRVVELVSRFSQKDEDELISTANELAEKNKENLSGLLDFFVIWYRDVLVYKSTTDRDALVYKDEAYAVSQDAANMSYASVKNNLWLIDKAREQLRRNVKPDKALVQMLLSFNKR